MAVRRSLAALAVVAALTAAGCSGVSDANQSPPAPVAEPRLGADRVLTGLVYAQRDSGPLQLGLYLPADDPAPRPLVVYAPGGGWNAGSRSLTANLRAAEAVATQRLLEAGYAVASVDYRLTQVAKAPAQVVDISDAVRWLQRRAEEWNLDPQRTVLWGSSAGGHLVAQLGAVTDDPQQPGGGLPGIRAVVDWFGPTDMSAQQQLEHPELQDYAHGVIRQLLGCLPVECPEVADASSPVKHISGAEPAFLIQHGAADQMVPIEQSLDFAAELRLRGVEVQMHPYESLGHGFGTGPHLDTIVDTMVSFLDDNV